MARHENDFNQQQQHTKPPRVDEIVKQKQEAEQQEVLGKYKNDSQNEHSGNTRQRGNHGEFVLRISRSIGDCPRLRCASSRLRLVQAL